MEKILRCKKAGGVEEYDLGVMTVVDPDHSLSCRLGLGCNDGDFLAEKGIDEGGFADIRCPNKRNITASDGR